jgi:hypothetical protein
MKEEIKGVDTEGTEKARSFTEKNPEYKNS